MKTPRGTGFRPQKSPRRFPRGGLFYGLTPTCLRHRMKSRRDDMMIAQGERGTSGGPPTNYAPPPGPENSLSKPRRSALIFPWLPENSSGPPAQAAIHQGCYPPARTSASPSATTDRVPAVFRIARSLLAQCRYSPLQFGRRGLSGSVQPQRTPPTPSTTSRPGRTRVPAGTADALLRAIQQTFTNMITLQEHIDALDRMVTNGTSVPELRSQIAFIGREVAALETRYMSAVDDNAQLRELQAKFQQEQAEAFDAFLKGEQEKQLRIRKSQSLNYNV
jgi:hypothetical protein